MCHRIALLLGLTLAAPSLTAQLLPNITVTGKVIAAPPSTCNQAATHMVDCTGVLLFSNTVDLISQQGKRVKLTGSYDFGGSLGCHTIEVDQVSPPGGTTGSFSFSNYKIGGAFILTTIAPLGNVLVLGQSFGSGFLPLGGFGTLLLDPLTTRVWSIDLSIILNLKSIQIPNDPNLVGCVAHFQVLSVDLLNPLQSEFYNPICFTVTQ